jgi:hypothetical protein
MAFRAANSASGVLHTYRLFVRCVESLDKSGRGALRVFIRVDRRHELLEALFRSPSHLFENRIGLVGLSVGRKLADRCVDRPQRIPKRRMSAMHELRAEFDRNRRPLVVYREDPAADAIPRLQHDRLDAAPPELARCAQARDPGPDDNYWLRRKFHSLSF